VRLMNSDETRPVNLGNPVEMTVLQIAETVIELSGSESPISFGPLPPGDPKRRCPDIGRAREVLGWEPRVPAREGLQKTLAWFAGRLGRPERPVPGR
jgi:nucleoside-diphosphate-sugar epimerase